MGPSGSKVISLQKIDSSLLFEHNGKLKRFCSLGPEGLGIKNFKERTQ
jgi:hypothetical protein